MVNLIIAYAVIATVLTLYIASIVVRTRQINRALRQEQSLQELL
jgi:uncharacterized membrane protein YecN with MAPEG domain